VHTSTSGSMRSSSGWKNGILLMTLVVVVSLHREISPFIEQS